MRNTKSITFDVCGFPCGKIARIMRSWVQRECRLGRILLHTWNNVLNRNCPMKSIEGVSISFIRTVKYTGTRVAWCKFSLKILRSWRHTLTTFPFILSSDLGMNNSYAEDLFLPIYIIISSGNVFRRYNLRRDVSFDHRTTREEKKRDLTAEDYQQSWCFRY